LAVGLVLVTLIVAQVLGVLASGPLTAIEHGFESAMIRWFEPGDQDRRLAVLDVDAEPLLAGSERQRAERIVELIDRLDAVGARAIGFLLPVPPGEGGQIVAARLGDRLIVFAARPAEAAGPDRGFLTPGNGTGNRLQSVQIIRPASDEGARSLALCLVERLVGARARPSTHRGDGWQIAAGSVATLPLPLDREGRVLVPMHSRTDRIPHRVAIDPALMRSRIVLVAPSMVSTAGASAAGADAGPADAIASTVSAILDERLKHRSVDVDRMLALGLAIVGLLLVFVLPGAGLAGAVLVSVASIVAAFAAAMLAWVFAGIVLPLGAVIVLVLSLLALDLAHATVAAARARRAFATVFGSYVPPALVEQMARDPASYRDLIAPRNETLTVLFADLRGFTAVAERMTPEGVRVFLDDYFTEMSEVVHEFGGTVDKYIGDEVMAFWGAPLADPEHARHAVLAAMRMREAIGGLRSRTGPLAGEELDLRVGVNTGLMSVGDMGSTLRRSYTVLGDSVNLAKRIESLTRYYGVGIMIGEQTRIRVPELVCREIDWVQVKGRGSVVTIHEPIGFADEVDSRRLEELEQWAQALQAYRLRRWQEADATLAQLQQSGSETGLYRLYRARIARFRSEPPPQWNGVTVFDRK
jgi:adenylate cyclase